MAQTPSFMTSQSGHDVWLSRREKKKKSVWFLLMFSIRSQEQSVTIDTRRCKFVYTTAQATICGLFPEVTSDKMNPVLMNQKKRKKKHLSTILPLLDDV